MRVVSASLPSGPPAKLSLVPSPDGAASRSKPLERDELVERFPSVNFGVDDWFAVLSGCADVCRRISLDVAGPARVLS